MIRLFTAIPVGEELSKKLGQIQTNIEGAQWVSPERFHITLVFMGDVNVYLYRQIKQQLRSVYFNSFQVKVEGIELFYDKNDEPKIIYAKIQESDEIKSLQKELLSLISMFHPNLKLKHSFVPHITLAHLHKSSKEDIEHFAAYYQEHDCCTFEANEFNLYSSRSTPVGSIYTKLESYEALSTFMMDYSDFHIL